MGDWPRRDVVGESFHESEIRSLFPAQIGELFLRAALVPDPRNEYDRNAVKVIVSVSTSATSRKTTPPSISRCSMLSSNRLSASDQLPYLGVRVLRMGRDRQTRT